VEGKKEEKKLKYVRLGASGLKVSNFSLGAMNFCFNAEEYMKKVPAPAVSKEDAFKLMDYYVENGGNFIDTANIYTNGESEKVIGEWLKSKGENFRKKIVISTKLFFTAGETPNEKGYGKKHILHSVQESLERLQTSYIDLLFLHCYDPNVKFKEVFSTLNALCKQGKILYLGVSNFTGWQLQKAVDLCREKDWESISALQTQYHLLCRSPEWELLQVCEREGICVHVWSPLAGSWLTGKMTRESKKPEEGSRVAFYEKANFEGFNWAQFGNEHTWNIVDKLIEIAKKRSVTVPQVALNWIRAKTGKASFVPIIGASKFSHLEDNLKSAEWNLTAEEMEELDKVSSQPLPYPYSLQKKYSNFTN